MSFDIRQLSPEGLARLTTTQGNRVRIYATNGGPLPDEEIHGAIMDDGYWQIANWSVTGEWIEGERHENDLILLPAQGAA